MVSTWVRKRCVCCCSASCSTDLTIKFWDLKTYKCTKTLTGHDHTVSMIRFMPSGDQLVSCSRDATIKVWEVSTGYCTKTLSAHSEWVRCIAVASDGEMLASAGHDKVVKVWSITQGTVVQELPGHENYVQSLCFSNKPVDLAMYDQAEASGQADGSGSSTTNANGGSHAAYLLASAGRDSLVHLWNATSGELLFTVEHANWVNEVVFHPSDKFVLSASDDRSIKVIDILKKRCVRTLEDAHGHFVSSISMSPQISKLFSGGVDKEVRVWDCR